MNAMNRREFLGTGSRGRHLLRGMGEALSVCSAETPSRNLIPSITKFHREE